jgi:hypothetical protein
MLILNMVLFLYLGSPLTPVPGLTAGKIYFIKKRPLNKNTILYSFIYHFKATFMLSLNMVTILTISDCNLQSDIVNNSKITLAITVDNYNIFLYLFFF